MLTCLRAAFVPRLFCLSKTSFFMMLTRVSTMMSPPLVFLLMRSLNFRRRIVLPSFDTPDGFPLWPFLNWYFSMALGSARGVLAVFSASRSTPSSTSESVALVIAWPMYRRLIVPQCNLPTLGVINCQIWGNCQPILIEIRLDED